MRADYHLSHIVNKAAVWLLHFLIIRLSRTQTNQKQSSSHSHYY